MDNNNLNTVINELQNITSLRTRFYTIVKITSEYFTIKQKLLYVQKIHLTEDYLSIFTDYTNYNLILSEDLKITYTCNEPVTDEKKLKRI